jgi:hypothetical protein
VVVAVGAVACSVVLMDVLAALNDCTTLAEAFCREMLPTANADPIASSVIAPRTVPTTPITLRM